MTPLLERDIERAFGLVVPDWQIERLDTSLGTEDCARYLKDHNQVVGVTLRHGRISWNRFANMATVLACELKYAGGEGESNGCAPAGGWGRRPPESFERGEQLTL